MTTQLTDKTPTLDKVNKLLELKKNIFSKGKWSVDRSGDIVSPSLRRADGAVNVVCGQNDNIIMDEDSAFIAYCANNISEIAQAFIEMSEEVRILKKHKFFSEQSEAEYQLRCELEKENTTLKSQIKQLKRELDGRK